MVREHLQKRSMINLNDDLEVYIKENGWVQDKKYKQALINSNYPGFYLFISDECGSSVPGKLYQIIVLKEDHPKYWKKDVFKVPYDSGLIPLLRPALMDTPPGIGFAKFLLDKEQEIINIVLNPKEGAAVIGADGKFIVDPYVRTPG